MFEGRLYENLALILKPEKCFTGGFTNVVFIKEIKSKHPVSFDTEKGAFKIRFYKSAFCKNDSTDEYYLRLKEELPNFMRVLEILKEEDNAHLSRLLQNIESRCIIDYVTKKIAKDYPEMPLLRFTILLLQQLILKRF